MRLSSYFPRMAQAGAIATTIILMTACSSSPGSTPATAQRSLAGGAPVPVAGSFPPCATAVAPSTSAGTVQMQATGALSAPTITLNVNVTNCAPGGETVNVSYSVASGNTGQTCGASTTTAPPGDFPLDPGSTRGISENLTVPNCTVQSRYDVTANVNSGGVSIASTKFSFSVSLQPFNLVGTVAGDPAFPAVNGNAGWNNDGTNAGGIALFGDLPSTVAVNSLVGIFLNGQLMGVGQVFDAGVGLVTTPGANCEHLCTEVGYSVPSFSASPVFIGTKFEFFPVAADPLHFLVAAVPTQITGPHLATATMTTNAKGRLAL